MSAVVENKIWTEAELQALPEDGFIHEVIAGELVMRPKNNFQHGNITFRLSLALGNFIQNNRLGVLLDSSTGFWMKNGNCRAPDISFVSRERLAGWKASSREFFSGAPDLAVEIFAPSNTRSELDGRLRDFFSSGTSLAWVIQPDEQTVEVRHSLTLRKIIGPGGFLEGGKVLPGFSYPVAHLFKELEWG